MMDKGRMTVSLLVCTTCRAGQPVIDGQPVPGARLFAALERLGAPEGVRKRVTAAFLKQAGDEPGKALLKDVRIPNPVAADYARDYGPLEKLRLDKYLVLEE